MLTVTTSDVRRRDPMNTTGADAMKPLWNTHHLLTAVSLTLAVALAVFGVGLIADPRTIAGAPAWLKPAKFAASLSIYGLTLVWMFGYLRDWPRLRAVAGTITAVVAVVEVGLIALQAWRGTTSHFNLATPFDIAVFSTMGAAIAVQWIASVCLAIALWRQSFDDRALGSALRIGMTLAVIGAAMGGLMTRPTDAQLAAARAAHRIAASGSHTVGGPDGGPGLPLTKWSMQHGDLRVPHFLGLHALQALPLLAFALNGLRRRITDGDRLHLVRVTGASYAALTAILLWQALRGQSIVAPDALTLAALAAWAVLTAAAAAIPFRRSASAWSAAGVAAGAR
jgi:hypothetical protein